MIGLRLVYKPDSPECDTERRTGIIPFPVLFSPVTARSAYGQSRDLCRLRRLFPTKSSARSFHPNRAPKPTKVVCGCLVIERHKPFSRTAKTRYCHLTYERFSLHEHPSQMNALALTSNERTEKASRQTTQAWVLKYH
jgi:hypothetical protein